MKTKRVVSSIIITTLFCILPFTANAADVPWLTQNYHVYAYVDEYGYEPVTSESYGPPLPIIASANGPSTGCPEAFARITSSTMNVVAAAGTSCGTAEASASFTGTFEANMPLFLFDYSSSSIVGSPMQYLAVNDNGTEVFSDFIYGSDTLTIPVTVGNTIEVEYGISAGDYGGSPTNTTTNYSMAVAPEPVSTVLFITGGTILGFRSLRKKAETV